MTQTTPRLSPRETTKRELLDRIAARNDTGETPSKHAVIVADGVGRVPQRTRAGQYRMIDDLIRRGLVADTGRGTGYALQVTEAGQTARMA